MSSARLFRLFLVWILVSGWVFSGQAAGASGYHASFFSESSFLSLGPGQSGQFAVGFVNTGTEPWVRGTPGEASLHTAAPLDNQVDFTAGWALGWTAPSIYATQSVASVARDERAFFVYAVQAPPTASGPHAFYGRLVIGGFGPLEDVGYFQAVTVQPGYSGGLGVASGPVAAGTVRFSGTVTDLLTKTPIAGACVYAGPAGACPSPNVNTDASGYWAIDIPAGAAYDLNFVHPAYYSFRIPQAQPPTVSVNLIPKPRAPPSPTAPPSAPPAAAPSPTHPARALRQPTAAAPLRVLLIGDSIAQGFGWWGLENYGVGSGALLDVATDAQKSTGLSRPDFFDWPARLSTDLGAYDPELIVALFGANDPQSIVVDGRAVRFDTPEWNAGYAARVSALTRVAVSRGAAMVWIGMPIMRDPGLDWQMAVLDVIYEAAAKKDEVPYIGAWQFFVDAHGHYAAQLPTVDGRLEIVRAPDGVHFTPAGAARLARFVLADLEARWKVNLTRR